MPLVILGHHHDLEPAVIAVRPGCPFALTIFTGRVCSLAPGMTSVSSGQHAGRN
jgi:hypothetical protein